jgi:hypothetical protein
MSSNQHTPGPWEVDLSGTVVARVMKGGFMVAKIRKLAHAWDTQVADAHLIAAAPDMAELLREVVSLTDRDAVGLASVRRKAFSLLSRATGEKLSMPLDAASKQR